MTTTNSKLIAYYRLSREKKRKNGHAAQTAWGWSLDSQQTAVDALARERSVAVLASYQEIETGKRADRPELAKAIAHAKRARATLVVAKLDRLARNVAFTSALMESGVDFVACDNPHANRLTIHILAAVAEDEARRTSERTKDALAAAKRRGVVLGAARPECRNLTDAARRRGARAAGQAVKQQADEAYVDLRDFLAALRPAFSFQQIADILNMRGERTRRGKPWTDVAVLRACQRLDIGSA
jgi:DNA invertase Pin-like site-specific DNA recombinase